MRALARLLERLPWRRKPMSRAAYIRARAMLLGACVRPTVGAGKTWRIEVEEVEKEQRR